jgi:parvulin-like peptidyl-prolyl isomerase
MAKRKKGVEEEPRELTRKEILHRSRTRVRDRKLYTWTGIAVGLALLLVLVGALYQFVVQPRSALAKVGDDAIITRDFWKRIHLTRSQMQNQLARLSDLQKQFGGQFFDQQIQQLQSTLSSNISLGAQVLDQLIDEKIVAQEAKKRGIEVTDQEVDDALREEIAAGRGAVTEPQATSTAEVAASETATATLWTPTPTPTIDASLSLTASATLTPTATPAPLPTTAVLSDTGYTEGQTQLTTNLKTIADMDLTMYRETIRARLLSDKLEKIISEEKVKANEEQVHARHILLREITPTPVNTDTVQATPTITVTPTPPATTGVTATTGTTATTAVSGTKALTATGSLTDTATVTGTTATTDTVAIPTPEATKGPRTREEAKKLAEELRTRIQNGEDFAQVAAVYSDDTGSATSGGDLGWFGKGRMVAPFEQAAFSLTVNAISEPISTTFGYHLIQVTEKDSNRAKDPQALQQERSKAYRDWLAEQKTAANIQRPEDLQASLPSDMR